MTSFRVREYLRRHVLGLVAIFIALTGTAVAANGVSDRSASTSVVTDTKFKKLKKRVTALEGRSTTPTGPAGGDLTGSYPNPALRDASVTTPKLADNAVTTAKIADGAITRGKLFLDTTRNFDFGVQVANTCTTFPFAVTGVLPTDTVIMTAPSGEPSGLITHANIGPAGMTELEICNPTAAPSADPPALDYRFTYIR